MGKIEVATLETIWDSVAPHDFSEAALQEVLSKNIRFKKLHLPRRDVPSPITIHLGFSLYGRPRFAAYRYRLILLPEDILGGSTRWQITRADIASFVKWAQHMKHVVTFSTLKSGASFPLSLHAQSFPLFQGETALTALAGIATDVCIGAGEMPHFTSLEIATLRDYPLHGIKITDRDEDLEDLIDKTYELALNYDALKSFNIVILPESAGVAERLSVFFFPRRRDGRAIFHFCGDRWQIAALEANGLLQAKTSEALAAINEEMIGHMFNRTGLNDHEFNEFLYMLETF